MELSEDFELAPHVTDCLTALGVSFAPGNKKPSPKEFSRFESATRTAIKARVRFLPGSVCLLSRRCYCFGQSGLRLGSQSANQSYDLQT
jgi:hypothetical protein